VTLFIVSNYLSEINTVNIQTEDVNATRKKVIISLSSEEISTERNSLVKQFAGSAKIPGFRPGKAPSAMIQKRYGKEIREELARKVITKAYEKVTKEMTLKIYGVVDIKGADVEENANADVCFTIDLHPEFALPTYKGLAIHKHPEEVTEKDVQNVIDHLRSQRMDYIVAEGPAAEGDYVKVSYTGKVDDQLIADLAPDDTMYGTQSVTWEKAGEKEMPGNEAVVQGILGMAPNEKKTVTHTFASDFKVAVLAGKTAEYEIEVKEVRKCVLPDINDEDFLESVEAKSSEELLERIKSQLELRKQQDNKNYMTMQLINQLIDAVEFEIPESAIDDETQSVLAHHMQHFMKQGVKREEFEAHKDTLLASARKTAQRNLKSRFLVMKIAEAEGIKIEDKDIHDAILREAYMSNTHPEALVKTLQKDRQALDGIRFQSLFNKTLEFLVGSANVTIQEHCDHKHDHEHSHEGESSQESTHKE